MNASPPGILGLDVGGANLKAAHSTGPALTTPFPLWRNPAGLSGALAALLRSLPPADLLAVTMTGELCDCFPSKREGVHAILDAVVEAADSTPVRVWLTSTRFVDVATARTVPLQAAASNWLSLAVFVTRYAPVGPALLLDVGSTTSDVIPLLEGRPVPQGKTDPERLRSRELVYTGVRRTPVCALLGGEGAAEFFATMLDVYLVLKVAAEDPEDSDTADGRPATQAAAHARLARMLCADLETSTPTERLVLARRAARQQLRRLTQAIVKVGRSLPGPPETVIVAGSGSFLADSAWRGQTVFAPGKIVRLDQELGPARSSAACAHAVAVLAGEARAGE